VHVVEQTTPGPYAAPGSWNPVAGGAWPVTITDQSPAVPVTTPFRATPLFVASTIAGALGVLASFLELFTIASDSAGSNSTVKVSDLFTNATISLVIAAAILVVGSAVGATGRRIGSGLAGGAGLALTGFAMLFVAVVVAAFDSAERQAREASSADTLTLTRELGFWVLVAAGVAGVVAFVLSLRDSAPDGRAPLSQGVGALGVLGTGAVMFGPLIPGNGSSFSDNFSLDALPPAFLYLRLASLLLIGVCGIVGFLNRRRWGIGLALGGICIALWQWFTTFTEQGDSPAGIAFNNLGGSDNKPHVVTTVGIIVMVVAAVASLVMAGQQRSAPRVGR